MAKVKRDHRKKSFKGEMAVFDVAVDESRMSVKETRKLFKRGNAALNANNYPLAAKHFFKAWESDQGNLYLLTIVSHILAKLGHIAVALEFIEKAIEVHGVTEDICIVMGEMALSLQMFEIAEKIFAQAVNFNPQEEKYYINIAKALEGQGNAEGAIQFMEEVVKILDESSDCWCMLGTLYKNNRTAEYFIKAFERSLEINPDNIVALNNYAGGISPWPISERLARRAIKLKPNLAEPHLILATYLLQNGKLKEGWEHYEYRNDPSRGAEQTQVYLHKLPRWSGQSLKGKSIFIDSEQGVGDEVMFARGIQHIVDEGATIYIGCDERLIDIYERSFSGTKAYAHEDTIVNRNRYRTYPEFDKARETGVIQVDYSLAIGSIPHHFWNEISLIPKFENGYLKPEPSLNEIWCKKLADLGGRPKIGISWRSGYVSRSGSRFYIGLENLLPLIQQIDADFICMQYDCTDEERKLIEEETGKKAHIWPEIDLKQDIDANLAIMSNLDLVIGPSIATQMFALAIGINILMPVWSTPWWSYNVGVNSSKIPYADNISVFKLKNAYDWKALVDDLIRECHSRFD